MAINNQSGALAVFMCLLGSHALQAQTAPNTLASIKALRCTFTVSASGNWKAGDPQALVKPEEIIFNIEAVDTQEGTASIVGAVEPTYITALLTTNSLHFLDRAILGNLTVITVFPQPDPKGKLRAVRSRHDYVPMRIPGFVSEPTVSQQYGLCEVVK